MQFADDSGLIVRAMLPQFEDCRNYRDTGRRFEKAMNKVLLPLYMDISKGDAYIENKVASNCLRAVIRDKKGLSKPSIYNSRFFPTHIRNYIEENMRYQLTYSCEIGKRAIEIKFAIFSEEELVDLDKYGEYARLMYIWLFICGENAPHRCAKTLSVYVYQTPFRKTLPSSSTAVIGADNVNTAFTFSCAKDGDMVIFRKEEWMKVFIHETFHSYGMDFSSHDYKKLREHVSSIFPVDSEFDIAEAYTETWARIINAAFASYNSLKDKQDQATFLLYMKFSLEMERLFALAQINKILGFMGLAYNNLHDCDETSAYLRKNLYREKTNVLAYYVVTGIFMNSYYDFLRWCQTHNPSYMAFTVSNSNFRDLMDFISEQYRSETLLEGLECTKAMLLKSRKMSTATKFLRNTTRMSAIELIC
jgi:hypothetical protein